MPVHGSVQHERWISASPLYGTSGIKPRAAGGGGGITLRAGTRLRTLPNGDVKEEQHVRAPATRRNHGNRLDLGQRSLLRPLTYSRERSFRAPSHNERLLARGNTFAVGELSPRRTLYGGGDPSPNRSVYGREASMVRSGRKLDPIKLATTEQQRILDGGTRPCVRCDDERMQNMDGLLKISACKHGVICHVTDPTMTPKFGRLADDRLIT